MIYLEDCPSCQSGCPITNHRRGAKMIKTSKPITHLLLCVLSLMVVSLACNLPRGDGKNLTLDSRADDGSLSGSYQSPGDSGGTKVDFSVTADGFATFHIDGAPESDTLTVDLNDEDTANLEWKGTSLDGLGTLTGEEQAALDDLMKGDLAYSLGMIPLDIACQGGEDIDPKQVAALLVPLQMRFKYLVTERSALSQELITSSQCDYGEFDSKEGERATFILLSRAAPVPVVLGYFPFDAAGAVEPPMSSEKGSETACQASSPSITAEGLVLSNWLGSSPETILGKRVNEWGPCNAWCRGACGSDCEPNNCKYKEEERCEKDDQKRNTGFLIKYYVYDCGLHKGCIEHDNCYDRCNKELRCDTMKAAYCRHGKVSEDNPPATPPPSWYFCDHKAIAAYGGKNTSDWALGYGPQPMRETFEYFDASAEKKHDLKECPLEESDSPTLDEEGDSIPVGTYVGTTDYTKLLEATLNPGKYSKNEVIITVADDGTVTGSFSIYYIGDTFVREDNNCAMHWEAEISGSFSGKLMGNSGTISSTETWVCVLHADCSDTGECDIEPIIRELKIQVSGDHMAGTTLPHQEDPEGLLNWTFEASK
jgi:hypothetical protein